MSTGDISDCLSSGAALFLDADVVHIAYSQTGGHDSAVGRRNASSSCSLEFAASTGKNYYLSFHKQTCSRKNYVSVTSKYDDVTWTGCESVLGPSVSFLSSLGWSLTVRISVTDQRSPYVMEMKMFDVMNVNIVHDLDFYRATPNEGEQPSRLFLYFPPKPCNRPTHSVPDLVS